MGTTFFYPYKEPRWDQYVLDSLNECMAAAEAAGTGTARVMGGTRAEREAYATPFNGLLWTETDTGYVWVYWDSAWLCLSKKDETDAAQRGKLTTTPQYSSSSQILIPQGLIGIGDQLCEVPEDILLTPPLTAGQWHFPYVDLPASGNIITADQISVGTTAPTKDAAKGGWYDAGGTKRCIGLFDVDGLGSIIPWREEGGGYYSLDSSIGILSTTSAATTPTLISAGVPSLGRIPVNINARVQIPSTSVANYVWLWNGDSSESAQASASAATGLYFSATGDAKYIPGDKTVITNAAGQIIYYANGAVDVQLRLNGFWLPAGMRRTN